MDRSASAAPARRTQPPVGQALAVLIAALALGTMLWVKHLASIPDRSDVRLAALSAASELERTPITGLGVYSFDVRRALLRANPAHGRSESIETVLLVRDAGMSGGRSFFEITNTGHQYPVCLIVTGSIDLLGSRPSFPQASVEDGACPSPATASTSAPLTGWVGEPPRRHLRARHPQHVLVRGCETVSGGGEGRGGIVGQLRVHRYDVDLHLGRERLRPVSYEVGDAADAEPRWPMAHGDER